MFSRQLDSILTYVEKSNEPTTNVEPMTQVTPAAAAEALALRSVRIRRFS